MSSLRPSFGEDVASHGLATAVAPTEGDVVVPRWYVLVPRCSSEPGVVETAPSPPWSGKYLHFLHAFSICMSLYLRSRSACSWHPCHFCLPIITVLLLIAFLQRSHLITNRRILDL